MFDVFVRWKPLSKQAMGWSPDLNDGVRLDIRPFVLAGILRKNPKVNWGKDKGKEPQRNTRLFKLMLEFLTRKALLLYYPLQKYNKESAIVMRYSKCR